MLALNSIVAIYDTQTEVEAAVRDLQQAAFDFKKLSIIGREHELGEQTAGYYSTRGDTKAVGVRGTFWNEIWKQLEGAGQFAIAGMGRVLTAGFLTVGIVEATEDLGEVPGLSTVVGAGLYAMSIPIASVARYEVALKMHKLLLVAHGSSRELLKCKEVLHASQPRETNIHFAAEGVQSAA
jgi:hypothetical protein